MLNHEQLLAMIREKVDHPATPRELLQRLKIPRDERPLLTRLLKDLVADGALIQTRGNRFGLPDRMNLIVGRITIHPRGFGFVTMATPEEAQNAIAALNGSTLDGRNLTVNEARPKTDRPREFSGGGRERRGGFGGGRRH